MAYDLQRFKDARSWDYGQALAEIRVGRKRSHWIWYVFPQLKELGRSSMCERYGIDDMGEAKAYLGDKTLRSRLVEISQALLELSVDDPVSAMGHVDALKLRSCMTLFSIVPGADPVFGEVLDRYYGGVPGQPTLELLGE